MRDIAAFFKVLADEARLRMLWLLFNHRELCVCDFIEVLGITQSKASRHLRILYRAGLVTDRREGLWVYYTLRPVQDRLAKHHLEKLRPHLADRPDAALLLERLSVWLRRKGAETRCAQKSSSRTNQRTTAGKTSSALSGGSRS
jgi:ArsR family transcriptional regulator, arsenate/arsenite/antimonite-responsive transcriptional repressor